MRIIKPVLIAFSIYSIIPVPQFAWKKEDMKYMLCFFPWIGAVVGGCFWLWNQFCSIFAVEDIWRTAVGAAIPLLITGGFHVDGFLDTMDAFHSWQPRERKLQILKDSHIGAFAVIMFGVYGLLYLGALSELKDERLIGIVCMGFFLARCLSGIGVLIFPLAKTEGMLVQFTRCSQKKVVSGVLCLQGACCVAGMLYISFWAGILAAGAAAASLAYYYVRCKRELGGITGDTAGYFVLLCELCIVITEAAYQIFCG